MAHGAKGPNYTMSTACSSSAHALGQAMQCIREGRADVVITVGADASITPLVFAGFCSLRALSTKYNDQPERASRPFDRLRDGFVMGEGAGALILESSAHAKKAKSAAFTQKSPDMPQPARPIIWSFPAKTAKKSLRPCASPWPMQASPPAHVDYINAHATSTTIGDAVETKAIRQVFRTTRGQTRHQRDEVARRPYLGSRGRHCRHRDRSGHSYGTDPSDRQLRGTGSRLRIARPELLRCRNGRSRRRCSTHSASAATTPPSSSSVMRPDGSIPL